MSNDLQEALRVAIQGSPNLFPFAMAPNGEAVQFVSLTEDDYCQASFLDHRLLTESASVRAEKRQGTVPWPMLEPWLAKMPVACDFIFHISHAGSTLLSRLLGSHAACFSIREPFILRSLAHGNHAERLRGFLALWSRTYRPEQRAMIKATSFVSEIGPELLELVPDAKAILMTVPPETFLASVLDGSMSDIESQASTRLLRLHQHHVATSCTVDSLSPGELAAMSWLSEMKALHRISDRYPIRAFWLDFDQFVVSPRSALSKVLQFLKSNADPDELVAHPIMQRYAKKTEVAYDASYRQRLIDQAQKNHGEEIERGLAWLKKN